MNKMQSDNSNNNYKKQERFHKLCQVMSTKIFTCYQGPSRQELIDTQTRNRGKRYSWKAGLKLFIAILSMPRSESTQIKKLVVPHPWRVWLAVNERQGNIIVCVAHHARLLGFNPQLHFFPVMSLLIIVLWVRYSVTRCRSRERNRQSFVICHTHSSLGRKSMPCRATGEAARPSGGRGRGRLQSHSFTVVSSGRKRRGRVSRCKTGSLNNFSRLWGIVALPGYLTQGPWGGQICLDYEPTTEVLGCGRVCSKN